ncbi:MAG: hypothetical protein IJN20_06450 [Oscillospiraceae bacterium]|nr:hypothetical protein [Oscillospiraceae bacterium]
MRPDDILAAIGEVDEIYVKKAHRKSLLKAVLVFAVIAAVLCAAAVSQLAEEPVLLRFCTDFSVNTGFIEPEALRQNQWTSLVQTTYAGGVPVSTTEFRRTLFDHYAVTHVGNGETTRIVGTSTSPSTSEDYLESRHYANLYIRASYAADLLDRIERVAIYSGIAYGDPNQELNHVKLEYLERGDQVHRQTRLQNGHTAGETVIASRGYSYQNGRISGWKEWDAEGALLAYADYTYDGNLQTVSACLADGTPAGTRVSQYAFGRLKWRETYNTSGELVSREVYRYRVWELFGSLEGGISLVIILSLAATFGIGIWDDRIRLGTRLMLRSADGQQEETAELIREVKELKNRIAELSGKLSLAYLESDTEEIRQLTEQLKELNSHLEKFSDDSPEEGQRR